MLDHYTVVDDKTIQLVAKDRFATFLENTVALVAIMPKHIWQDVPAADWGTDPGSTGQDASRVFGSGPFKFVEWVQGDHVGLEKNADYWDPNFVPNIDTFTYRVIPEASSATQALLTGEIDFTGISFAEAPDLRSNPDLNIAAYDTTSVNWFAANQDASKIELFTDPKVRQALMYALDRKLVAEQVYNGYAIQADGTQPVLSVPTRPDEINTVYDFDTGEGEVTARGAGWTDSDGDGIRDKDGVKFEWECLYSEGVAPPTSSSCRTCSRPGRTSAEHEADGGPVHGAARWHRHRLLRHGRVRLPVEHRRRADRHVRLRLHPAAGLQLDAVLQPGLRCPGRGRQQGARSDEADREC